MAAPAIPEPMRAVTGDLPPDESGWAFEVKWDGVRVIGAVIDGELVLRSSNGRDITIRYPELAGIVDQFAGRSVVLDGEVVRLDESGRPNFGELQARMHLSKPSEIARLVGSAPVTWVLFDLLEFDGTDTTSLPYADRHRLLESLVEAGPYWQVPAAQIGHGAELLEAVRARGLEGVMAKKVDSPYLAGKRSSSWRKVKVRLRQELVVGGWRPGRDGGSRADSIGSLLVGAHDGDRLVYAGRVGSGLGEHDLRWFRDHFASRTLDRCPFDPAPTRAEQADATWVEPDVVVEVEFGEWSHEARLRHPVYLGRRDDKDAGSVVFELPPGAGGD
jgi:bifunctional non-homologous end joining protein LigD